MTVVLVAAAEPHGGATAVAVGLAMRLADGARAVRVERLAGDDRAAEDAALSAALEFADSSGVPLDPTAIEGELAHAAQHVTFIAVATLLWWNVIDPKPLRSRVPHLPRMLYVFAAAAPKHILGAFLTFADDPLYDSYETATPILGLSVMDDQALGGLIMWIPSLMMVLAAMGIIFAVWARKAEQQQRAMEAARN